MEFINIAVIGAGPAGISSAVEAVMLKMNNIAIFEKGNDHSMTIRTYYKDNKRVDKDWKGQKVDLHGNILFCDGTKETTLDLFDKMLKEHAIEALYNTEIESVVRDEKEHLFKITTVDNKEYKALNIIIAIGNMGKPNKPNYPLPASLKKAVGHNLDHCQKDEKILVVGGGNSAIEYAYFLADYNDVVLVYRRGKFSRANPENLEIIERYQQEGKINIKFNTDIVSIDDENGKIKVNYPSGESELFDKAVYAIGGMAPIDFLKKCGVKLNDRGFPEYNENFETNVQGIYVAGDLAVRIGGSIGASLNHGFKIVKHIIESRCFINEKGIRQDGF